MMSLFLPVPSNVRVSQTAKDHTNRPGNYNAALDFAAVEGTPVYCAAEGVVVSVIDLGRRSYGLHIIIDHNLLGLQTVYGHLRKILVMPGQIVYAGQQIAESGNTGNSSGPHLHFEVRQAVQTWKATDPAPYLGLELPDTLSGLTNRKVRKHDPSYYNDKKS